MQPSVLFHSTIHKICYIKDIRNKDLKIIVAYLVITMELEISK